MEKRTKIENIRHSLAHLLASAVLEKYPKAKLGIGPVIENGFYYDIKFPKPLKDEDLPLLEKRMKELALEKIFFKGEKVTALNAKKIFRDQPFKLDLIKDFSNQKKQLTIYRARNFVDLCRGGHVKNTSEINPNAFMLLKTAGAYWKGNEKNPQLTRIYGAAFETKKELDNFITARKEAERRDHKKLGIELDLFIFSDLVGAGLPLWTPKGTILRNLLDDFVWKLRKEKGYQKVEIPHITKKDLYIKSGHWEKFNNQLFKMTSREGHEFALKPMNCPHHTQIYASRQRSFRELPHRYANTTMVYRDEQSGELGGLARVRAITQDDAHVFCRQSQIKVEIEKIWDIINIFYGTFGLTLSARLSLRDPKKPKNYLGEKKSWKLAEDTLRKLVKEKRSMTEEAMGEAAFYGPKIDFMAKDSLGREFQVATIQLDMMNLPERFDLYCINEKGEKERVVMIHAAIMGSIERFMAIIIEHYAGAFPFWLAPVQAIILNVNDAVLNYTNEILRTLEKEGIRASTDERNETIGKKIREAELQKIPFIFIIGPKEQANRSVSVREHGKGERGMIKIDEAILQMKKENSPL